MVVRGVVRHSDPSAASRNDIKHHTKQGLAGLRDRVGAKEESWPYLVSAATGVAGLVLASTVGAAELAVGVAAAYVAYDVIARGVPLWDAVRQAEEEIEA